MTQHAAPVTESASPPRVWDTRDVAPGEAFDYYREGICAAFMPLRPELGREARATFRAGVHSHEMPGGEQAGALNIVSARSHSVLRTGAEIASSPMPCWYVNLQLGGLCAITQAGRTVALHPGEVGLFDSDAPFTLDHSRRSGLRVASLMVPKSAIPTRFAPGPHRLSDHPVYGALCLEAARALTDTAQRQGPLGGLHEVFLKLVGLAAEDAGTPSPDGATLRIHAAIRANAARPGWSLADCAAEIGLSARQIQRLLAAEDDGFAAALSRERLARAARLLRAPGRRLGVADIAFAVGYSDPAPFARAFRAAYGLSPGAWRRGEG